MADSIYLHFSKDDRDPREGRAYVQKDTGSTSVELDLGKVRLIMFPGTKDVDLLSVLAGATRDLDRIISEQKG